MKLLANESKIISIDKVKNELYDKSAKPEDYDDLEKWCRSNLPDNFFKETTHDIVSYSKVVAWAHSKGNHYSQAALHEFLDADEADAFLVAHALSDLENRTVVTYEKSDPITKKKIKIPEACNHFNIKFITSMNMFRELGETF